MASRNPSSVLHSQGGEAEQRLFNAPQTRGSVRPRSATARRRLRRSFVCFGVTLLSAFGLEPTFAQAGSPGTTSQSLIDVKDLSRIWDYHSSESKSKLSDTWTVDAVTDAKVPVLICKGKPNGYIRTKTAYENFVLTLEWMYPNSKAVCNSGILIHANGKDKLWPASIQVQLHQPFAGSIFPIKNAKTNNEVRRKNLKLVTEKWYPLKIKSENGTITVWIDGKQVGQVTGCMPSKGFIALQSEGTEIRFRKIEITKIEPKTSPKQKPEAKPKAAPSRPAGNKTAVTR